MRGLAIFKKERISRMSHRSHLSHGQFVAGNGAQFFFFPFFFSTDCQPRLQSGKGHRLSTTPNVFFPDFGLEIKKKKKIGNTSGENVISGKSSRPSSTKKSKKPSILSKTFGFRKFLLCTSFFAVADYFKLFVVKRLSWLKGWVEAVVLSSILSVSAEYIILHLLCSTLFGRWVFSICLSVPTCLAHNHSFSTYPISLYASNLCNWTILGQCQML